MTFKSFGGKQNVLIRNMLKNNKTQIISFSTNRQNSLEVEHTSDAKWIAAKEEEAGIMV